MYTLGNLTNVIGVILSTNQIFLAVMFISFLYKMLILLGIVHYSLKTPTRRNLSLLLVLFLLGSVLTDFINGTWLFCELLGYKGEFEFYAFLCRITCSLYITQNQSLALFLESMQGNSKFHPSYIVHGLINIIISSGFIYLAFFKYHIPSSSNETLLFESRLVQVMNFYIPILFIPIFYRAFKTQSNNETPRILAHQIRYLTIFFIPYLFVTFVNNLLPFIQVYFPGLEAFREIFDTLTTLLSTYALYYITQRMLKLRFLNVRSTVESPETFNFLSQFRDILEQLSYATALKELAHLTQTFFHTAFAIPLGRTRLYIRKAEQEKDDFGYLISPT